MQRRMMEVVEMAKAQTPGDFAIRRRKCFAEKFCIFPESSWYYTEVVFFLVKAAILIQLPPTRLTHNQLDTLMQNTRI